MSLSISFLIDGHPACFANTKSKGDAMAKYDVYRNFIRLTVIQFLDDGRGNNKNNKILAKSLKLENEVEIQFLDSDQPPIKGEVTHEATNSIDFPKEGKLLLVKKNNVELTKYKITNSASFHANVYYNPKKEKCSLSIHFREEEDKDASNTDYPLQAGDNIKIAFEK